MDIVLSEGPEFVTVPDVVCDSQAKAQNELERAGFEVVFADEARFNLECPKVGQVADQDPAGDTSAQFGSIVTLYESTDLPPFTDSPSPGDD